MVIQCAVMEHFEISSFLVLTDKVSQICILQDKIHQVISSIRDIKLRQTNKLFRTCKNKDTPSISHKLDPWNERACHSGENHPDSDPPEPREDSLPPDEPSSTSVSGPLP